MNSVFLVCLLLFFLEESDNELKRVVEEAQQVLARVKKGFNHYATTQSE